MTSTQTTLVVHILAGGLGLVTGFVALFAAKGARRHRRSGMLFVYSMIAMALHGAVIAALKGTEISVIAGLLTAYMVITALTTARPAAAGSQGMDVGMTVVALAVGVASFALGFQARATPTVEDGIPADMFFLFGTVALLAGGSDIRVIRSGGLQGAARLTRHLWRMCYALWVASASFFLGQADEFPPALRIPALLAVPVLVPLVAMLYWLWRVRIRGIFRGTPRAWSQKAT